MPDHDLVAAPFADRHVATGSVSIVAPIVAVTIAPIVIAIVITAFAIDSVSVTAVRSDAEVQLSKRHFGFGRDSSVSGVGRQSPHYARDGGDSGNFTVRTSFFADNIPERGKQNDRVFVLVVTDI
jgi:hypothetical protein